jgi:F420-non-reducing hydrogenase iron-sulfur subunit
MIRVMCSGRVDLAFVFRAFSNGMDGVFIGGCHLNECHYITDGNHHAFSMVQLCKKILVSLQINPERLRIEQLSAGEGIRFAEAMNEFSRKLRAVGPLGKGEGIDLPLFRSKLKAVNALVPYIRLVERERLRVRLNTAEEYDKYYGSDEIKYLIQELILDKVAISQILLLLQEKPLSVGEISGITGLNSSEVSRHLGSSTRQGFARFDENQKRFISAWQQAKELPCGKPRHDGEA